MPQNYPRAHQQCRPTKEKVKIQKFLTTWLRKLSDELGFTPTQQPLIWCDNISASYLSANPVFHARTKRNEIEFHFILDLVRNGQLKVKFLSTKDQIAGMLTKPLAPTRFTHIRFNLNVKKLPFRLWGLVKDGNGSMNHEDCIISSEDYPNV